MSSFHTFLQTLIETNVIPTMNFLVYVRHSDGSGYGRKVSSTDLIHCSLFDSLRENVTYGTHVELSSLYCTMVLQYIESGWNIKSCWTR